MTATYMFALKRVSLANCCLFFWLGLTLISSMEFTKVSADEINNIYEVKLAEAQIEIGGNITLTCQMNSRYFIGYNSSCLSFYREHSNISVSKENIDIVNEYSIIYFIRGAKEEQTDKYNCKCTTNAASKEVSSTKLVVGINVTDFKCRDHNLNYMDCKFTIPESKIHTDYKLKMGEPVCGKDCDLFKFNDTSQIPEKFFKITGNMYRHIYDYYNFILYANNSLGTFNKSIQITKDKYIVPPAPTVEVGNLTTNSFTLYLTLEKWYHYILMAGHLKYKILVCPGFDCFNLKFNNIETVYDEKRKHYKAEIHNLQYPYRRYNFSVVSKTSISDPSDETMWSEPFKGNFTTMPRRPDRAPNTDVGSFYIDSEEKQIHLYWEKLPDYEQNGPGFNYNFTEVWCNGKLIKRSPLKMDDNSAAFTYEYTSNYTLKLNSQNEYGKSLDSSVFEIRSRKPSEVSKQKIQKITQDSSRTVFWERPKDFNNLSNLTIFICEADDKSYQGCMGDFHFKTLNKNRLNYKIYNISSDKKLNFALSKNYKSYSTGMLWASECNLDEKQEQNNTIQIIDDQLLCSYSSITVQWKSECWYSYIFKDYEYNLTYCIIENKNAKECTGKSKSEFLPIMETSYSIKDLKPSTYYKIRIRMVFKDKKGPLTEKVFKTVAYNNNIKLKIGMVFLVVFCVFFLYASRRKYLKEADLDIIIPDGILDCEIKKPTIKSRIKDFLNTFKKQNKMLEPINKTEAFVCNGRNLNIQQTVNEEIVTEPFGPQIIENNILNGQSVNEEIATQEPTESDEYENGNLLMESLNNSSINPKRQDICKNLSVEGYLKMNESVKTSNGYVLPNPSFTSLNGNVAPNTSYITFPSLNGNVAPNTDYITFPSLNGNVASNTGYITLSSLNENVAKHTGYITLPSLNGNVASNTGYIKLPSLNGNVASNTGYITLSKLNETIKKEQLNQGLKFLWFFVITMCLATSPVSASDYVGEVIPHDVELPIGGSVNITCRMNRSYFDDHNSSCLAFFRDDGNLRVPNEHIHVVDDSSIVFMVRNATEQRAQYTCKCHNKGVYITNIFVGTPPTNVTDFQCLGYDFSFMTCNFTVPHNKIYTDYKLKFSSSSPDYIYICHLENGHQPFERICNLTMDNNNYRIVYQYYNFELTASNKLGNLTQSIMIDQYNRIVPARPLIEVGNLTTNSVTLYWVVNKFSQYTHTDGLQYEIRLRPEKFDWFYIDTNAVLQKNKEHYKTEINILKYPYRRYDFSVRVKTVRANNSDETMWSEPYEGIFYTKPRRPERAPNMDVGSFYIDPTEQNIRLYWQQLAEYEENGPDFLYNITEVRRNGKLINVSPSQMDSTSATYNWERTSHYQFKLQSQNQVGKSLNTSTLEVHPSTKRSQQIEQIQVITKVYHNQTYTITWRQPSDMDSLRNFTLFWCISKMESQSQCKGTIDFKHFDKHTTNHTTEPQNHTLNFAVSANYDTYSTGMMWAMCTADGATDLNKMDPETSAISSNSIKVQWSTECLYMGILEGYNLTYCKVENHVPEMIGHCINTEKTISISKRAKEYTITKLDPFSTYKISILMYSKLKTGPMSNPVIETTTEDAPSPPRKLKKYNVTSDSVTLSWLPPKHSNGHLRYYTVWYKNEGTIVNSTSNDNESEIFFLLEDLSSYSDYKVYVTAHTVKSSGPSNDIHFKTLIGIPSPPLAFNMNRNEKELVFHWSPPKLPSGRVEFYEVRVTVNKNNESEILKTSRVVGQFCKMTIPCNDPNNSYIFDVRAVNLAERSEVDYHTFSKRDTSYLNNIHKGGPKKRRHSNAEINASIGAPYQIHETTEKNIRHRHERENLKLTQATEPSYVTQEESDEDFICIGGKPEHLKIPREYKDANQYKLFYSPWQNGPYFACSETKFSKLTMLALIVIVVTMVLLATVYYARKKYNKMSNISLVIPEGLVDNINVSNGIDNKIERDEIIRSDELFYEKENHRLLSKVGNDSGFLNSVHCLDKSSGYACSDLQDSEKSSQSTDSVELNDITSCSYTSSPSHSPNANIREMSIPEERMNSPVIQPSVQLRPSENGYIKPIMMSNGYVQPQAFQKLQPKETPSFNGYTSLDAMGKPIFPQTSTAAPAPIAAERNSYEIPGPKNVNNKDIAIPHPVSGNICGYVTHKQLSDFGRLQ